MRLALSWSVVIIISLAILAGYFVPYPPLQAIRYLLIDWAITLAGVATIIGVINLVIVHAAKVREEKPDWFNSMVLLMAFGATFIFGMIFKPSHPAFNHLVTSIQFPIEASLLALLSVTLIAALIRAIRPGMNGASILFIAAVLIFLWAGVGLIPLQTNTILQPVLTFLNTIQIGGTRGILLGIALGALVTGLRLIIGRDLPSGK